MKKLLTALVLFSALGRMTALSENDLPGDPFPASRYEPLWKSSPFSVVTPVAVESAEYSLVGAAQLDGISYVSLIEKQNQEHFVVTSGTPAHGLTLISLVHGNDSTFATLQKNGALLKLKLETGASPTSAPVAASAPTAPAIMNNLPGSYPNQPPRARYFRRPINFPRPNP